MAQEQSVFGQLTSFYKKRYLDMAGISEPASCPPLAEVIDDLTKVSDLTYARYGFLADPMRGRVTDTERDALIEQCFREGDRYAEELRMQYPQHTPMEIAHEMRLTVKTPVMPEGGGRVIFAEYEEPKEIRLYRDGIDKTNALITDNDLSDRLDRTDIAEVLCAHELYHHVEFLYKDSIFSLNHRICVWKLFSYRHMAHLTSLSEITAMRFAKRLCDLSYSAYLFDVLMSWAYQPSFGGELYRRIMRIQEASA